MASEAKTIWRSEAGASATTAVGEHVVITDVDGEMVALSKEHAIAVARAILEFHGVTRVSEKED